jgi:hypothetical protein
MPLNYVNILHEPDLSEKFSNKKFIKNKKVHHIFVKFAGIQSCRESCCIKIFNKIRKHLHFVPNLQTQAKMRNCGKFPTWQTERPEAIGLSCVPVGRRRSPSLKTACASSASASGRGAGGPLSLGTWCLRNRSNPVSQLILNWCVNYSRYICM